MDFGALLHYAKKKNDAATKDNEGKFYSTKYSPPKRETNKSKQLSINIQKFLKKREAEEAERKREDRQKLAELMAKRDEKSKNKIRKMLKVTKSANKSVLEDAKDCDIMNAECGPDGQPGDGDDYGYVSNEANAFYQKYIEKVRNVHEDKGFAPSRPQSLRDISGTKERVKAAIIREHENAKSGQRTRTSVPTSASSSKSSKDPQMARAYSTSKTIYDPDNERRDQERKKLEEEQERKAKIKRQPQPPPMDFQALLRLAEKKQHEPVVFVQPEKKKEPERLLSAKEKREQEERQKQKEQRAQRDRQRENDAKVKDQQPTGASKMVNGRIPKLSTATATATKPSTNEPKGKPIAQASSNMSGSSTSSAKSNLATSTKTNSSSKAAVNLNKPGSSSSSSSVVASKPKNPYAKLPEGSSTREFPPRDRPSNSMPNKTRQFPPPDVRGRNPMPSSSSSSSSRKPQKDQNNKRRIYDEDDSEYDSELDGFIDDNDCEEDISSHIRDIFGYDKRRYRDLDDDDRQMESSFAQMQREEFISKKFGLQEDLEDMRVEAMNKKRKIAKKKAKRLDYDDD